MDMKAFVRASPRIPPGLCPGPAREPARWIPIRCRVVSGYDGMTPWPEYRRTAWVPGLVLLLGFFFVSLAPGTAAGDDPIFQDDFNRPDAMHPGNGWVSSPMPEGCGETGDVVAPRQGRQDGRVSVVQLREGQLHFDDQNSRNAQRVYRDFRRPLLRLAYDFTPIYVMGGSDDRARLGVRIQFLDVAGNLLAEIGDFYYSTAFGDFVNTPTAHWRANRGPFDTEKRHSEIPIQEIMDWHLRDVDRTRIDHTRIIFEAFAGWCGSTLEAAIDNVKVVAVPSLLLSFNPEELADMVHSAHRYYQQAPQAFPGNWRQHIDSRYGQKKVDAWRKAIMGHIGQDTGRLLRLVERMVDDQGPKALETAMALSLLLWGN
ncbi:MAG: hypothetical protein HQL63_03795 [Magnetococcales bacterium]|nr:hypothetical protein [Magnetococcales bacterium]MBF0321875.1 hypothetical protein [Magnetococcales bacterium]